MFNFHYTYLVSMAILIPNQRSIRADNEIMKAIITLNFFLV